MTDQSVKHKLGDALPSKLVGGKGGKNLIPKLPFYEMIGIAPADDDPRLTISVREAAEISGLSTRTIHRKLSAGRKAAAKDAA